jgi:serine/threonine protein kinase
MGVDTEPGGAHPRTLFHSGEVLNGVYEIRGLIGEGGMGQVFDARDLSLNREVAIKAYWPIESLRAGTLRHEAQAQAAVQHPGLPAVFTIGRHGALDFLVMERIRGIGLDETLAQRHRIDARLPLGETIRILLAMADVLAAVHTLGCVHRDVKPGNVLLAAQRVVLTDFGLSRAEGEAPDDPAAGSPNYMAPESILDHVERGAGHRVDLYALGVIAFEMLAGRLPYVGRSLEDTFAQHVNAPVPALEPLAAGVPPRLAALVRSLLAKDPYDRPESEELVWRLRTIREDHLRGVRRSLTPLGVNVGRGPGK